MGKIPPDRSRNLRDLLRRAESVEPRHQGCLQACRDIDHRADVALAQPIDGQECYIRTPYPRQLTVGPGGHDQQHTKIPNPIDDPTKRL
jgi:hypothetical protein